MIKVITKLYVSDHDGYCSEDECQLSKYDLLSIIPVPKFLRKLVKKDGVDTELSPFRAEQYLSFWREQLPKILLHCGSCYCGLSEECENEQLQKHEYKYEITNLQVVDLVHFQFTSYERELNDNWLELYYDNTNNAYIHDNT